MDPMRLDHPDEFLLSDLEVEPYNYAWFNQEIVPSADHAVLCLLGGDEGQESPPPPVTGELKWDSDHVRMPCAEESRYATDQITILGITISSTLVPRWPLIKTTLEKVINNSQELADAISSYNNKSKYPLLHKFFNEYLPPDEANTFFKDLLPKIARLALDLPNLIKAPIPLLKKQQNKSVSLSQQQIASLLANAFFCTFSLRNAKASRSENAKYSKMNFSSLYQSNEVEGTMEKMRCICHYFKRVCNEPPTGVVTFALRCVQKQDYPNWETSTVPISSFQLSVTSETNIENTHGLIQVVFSNNKIGKGVLGRELLQEEARFLTCPELMISKLLTETLDDNEAVMIIGSERYSNSVGFGRVGFRWHSDHRDSTPLDSNRRRRSAVLAIDATYFINFLSESQYDKYYIDRELNKAWVGFSFFTNPTSVQRNHPGVATGNWGCGGLNGSPQLKSLIQILACAQSRRSMTYCTYLDAELKDSILQVYNTLKRCDVTVGQLYIYLCYVVTFTDKLDIHKTIKDIFQAGHRDNQVNSE